MPGAALCSAFEESLRVHRASGSISFDMRVVGQLLVGSEVILVSELWEMIVRPPCRAWPVLSYPAPLRIPAAVVLTLLANVAVAGQVQTVAVVAKDYSFSMERATLSTGDVVFFTTYDGSTGVPLGCSAEFCEPNGEVSPLAGGDGTYGSDDLSADPLGPTRTPVRSWAGIATATGSVASWTTVLAYLTPGRKTWTLMDGATSATTASTP